MISMTSLIEARAGREHDLRHSLEVNRVSLGPLCIKGCSGSRKVARRCPAYELWIADGRSMSAIRWSSAGVLVAPDPTTWP